MLERIRRYKYDPHFLENLGAKAEARQAVKEQEADKTEEKKGLLKKIVGLFRRLFHQDVSV